MFEIEFYQLPNGTKPAEEFLDSLDTKMRAKALHIIRKCTDEDMDVEEDGQE